MPEALGILRPDAARTLRSGVVGAGYFGERHAVCYGELSAVAISAACDVKADRARELASRFGAEWTTDYRDLVGKVDCVSIVTPDDTHFEIASFFLHHGIHVLVEKPICKTVEQADMLIRLANSNRLVLNVGHVERFNPVVRTLFQYLDRPQFIKARRLSPQRDRGDSSNVVLDLMIHDLDLILQAMDDVVRWIEVDLRRSPAGTGNYVHAQLEFQGGSSASVVAGHVSTHTERTMRVIQPGFSIEADLRRGTLALLMPTHGPRYKAPQGANVVTHRFGVVGSLLAQIENFVRSIEERSSCLTSVDMARHALEIALTISNMIDGGLRRVECEVDAAAVAV
jgi:predicted dehydrogenase